MNQQQFLDYVASPNDLNAGAVEQLETLANEFPWFAAASMLYTKALHIHKSIQYSTNMRQTSAVAPKRNVLYELVIKAGVTGSIVALEGTVSDILTATAKDSEIVQKVDTDPSVENPEHLGTLERQILEAAVSSSITFEVAEKAKKVSNEPSTVFEQPVDTGGVNSFSGWLKLLGESPTTNQSAQGRLIDQFIHAEEPNAPKAEFFSPTNMAKLSLVDDEDFVTETLADIYAKQGNLEKAIRAYAALALKIPEKSSYFAARQKKLAQILRSKTDKK